MPLCSLWSAWIKDIFKLYISLQKAIDKIFVMALLFPSASDGTTVILAGSCQNHFFHTSFCVFARPY